MITNYFKIAWRNIRRNKAFSLINILGLSLGMSSSILIILWVMDEKSIDRFHANDDYLFQVYQRNTHDGIIDAS
ncbi:MAG TPA: ABC transporter permease, partial [Flavitalea sp.]|nr:ABC transporter permease [Flavitalea sp.]